MFKQMPRQWWTKFVFLILIALFSTLYIVPTFLGATASKFASKLPFSKKINLGLDLQGGLYLVMGVDFKKVYADVAERQFASLTDRSKDKGISLTGSVAKTGDDPKVNIQVSVADQVKAMDLIKDEFGSLRITGEKTTAGQVSVELGLANDFKNDIRERTLNQSIEVIRNRVDEFGVAEPQISSQGNDRVIVELPGIKEVDRAKELIGRTAKLEFKMADDQGLPPGQLEQMIAQIEKEKGISFQEGVDTKFSEYVRKLNEAAVGKLPAGDEIAFEKNQGTQGSVRIPYLLKSKTEVTGNDLQDAQVTFNQENRRPEVAFELNAKGAIAFEKLTGDNIGKRLAIVLDGIVHSAPVINSKIGARGVITTGRGGYEESLRESKDLAIVLRAGALPAQLELMEQRVVGPSLGADSVAKGAYASLLGILAVFLFTAVYYRVAGMIAVASLLLNVILVLAILVWLEATLTLPGIAGVALTVGIAVDSNVVIYERIREELRAGKAIAAAVEAGFGKAFKTILDANVANGIAAVILMIYGTGPVKGFAVTMLVGIVTTLFTAIFACRVLFDLYLRRQQSAGNKTLSI